jgi:hypothetical protein
MCLPLWQVGSFRKNGERLAPPTLQSRQRDVANPSPRPSGFFQFGFVWFFFVVRQVAA